MIWVDPRVGSAELLPVIQKLGVEAKLETLEAGDVQFTGNGPNGTISIGIERKKVHDILACIDDGRFAGVQQHGMRNMYDLRFLIVEGIFKPSADGELLEANGGGWHGMKHRSSTVMYDKLFRYLLSVLVMGRTMWVRSGSQFETAWMIVSMYHYFNKKWDNHTSQLALPQLAFPQLVEPSFEQRVAAQVDGIGIKRSLEVAKHFGSVPRMVEADESEWMSIVGPKTAMKIVRQIHKR